MFPCGVRRFAEGAARGRLGGGLRMRCKKRNGVEVEVVVGIWN